MPPKSELWTWAKRLKLDNPSAFLCECGEKSVRKRASLMSLQTPSRVLLVIQSDQRCRLPRAAQARPASAVKIDDGADEETDLQRGERIHVHPDTHCASWNLSLHNSGLWWPAHTQWAVGVLATRCSYTEPRTYAHTHTLRAAATLIFVSTLWVFFLS